MDGWCWWRSGRSRSDRSGEFVWRRQVYLLAATSIRYVSIWRNLDRRMHRGRLWFMYRYWGEYLAFVVIQRARCGMWHWHSGRRASS